MEKKGTNMTTEKYRENKYIFLAIIMILIMIVSSLLVSFNIEDALYLLLIAILSTICYFRCK